MNKTPKQKTAGALSTTVTVLLWVMLWQALSAAAKRNGMGLLLPSPAETLKALAQLMQTGSFYAACGKSLLRVIAGWFTGMSGGVLLAVLTSIFKPLKTFFSPVLHIVKATPVASFIIAALVVMSSKKVPSFTGFLISLPIVWGNITEGISAPDEKLLEAAHFFNVKKKNLVRYIYIPAIKPYFAAAATTSMGLSWKACIAAEIICTPSESVGQGIYNAKIYLETPSLFAWTATVILLSVILEKLIKISITKFISGEKKKND